MSTLWIYICFGSKINKCKEKLLSTHDMKLLCLFIFFQRVSCILCLLYVTMLANAMFYNTAKEDEQANNAFAFGPFSVSPEQVSQWQY